jgi:translation initiation factor IF-2
MTDQNPSGASLAPAADTQAPAASADTPAGNFGSTRGSGLARGKRQSSAAAPTENTAKSDYKPIALEVITPVSEYRNPFASPEPENPPAAQAAAVETPAAPAAAQSEPEPVVAPEAPVVAEPVAERHEIQILPPAEAIRPSVSWESPSATRRENPSPNSGEPSHRDERPTFRPDRREDAANGPGAEGAEPRSDGRNSRNDPSQRQPRDPREARQPRDPREARQPRDPRDERQPRDPRFARQPRDPRDEQPRFDQRPQRYPSAPAEQAAPAAKGFFGWLKSLFGGSKPVEAPAPREFGGERNGDGQRHRRRHRGGRGHGGNPQGFRSDRSFQGGPRTDGQPGGGDGENRGGDRQGGHRRRRHRGGPGRDRGGEPRSEGQQGGGAI